GLKRRQLQWEAMLHGHICKMRDKRFLTSAEPAQLAAEFDPNLRLITIGGEAGRRHIDGQCKGRCRRQKLPTDVTIFMCGDKFTHCVPPLEVLCDANAEQTWICEEDVCCKSAVVAVQEGAGNISHVENVLQITHDLPAVLACQDQREIDVGVAAQAVIRIAVED